MSKRKGDYAVTTWADLGECIPAWEREYGCRVEFRIHLNGHLRDGAFVEVVLFEGHQLGIGREVYRHRAPFPIRSGAGQAGSALHCAFEAFNQIDSNPWLWPELKRRTAVTEG